LLLSSSHLAASGLALGDAIREGSVIMADAQNVRAEIFETGNERVKAARIIIDAPAAKIFDLLANPSRHKEIDG